MATIRKRGARWQAQVRRAGQPHLSKSFLLRADAEAWGRQKEVEADRGEIFRVPQIDSNLRVRDLLQRYLLEVTPKKRGAGPEAARLKRILADELATLSLLDLRPAHFARFRDKRLVGVSKSSVRRELVILRHCFAIAKNEWGLLTANPVERVSLPPDSSPRSRRPSPEELGKLLAILAGLRNPLPRLVFQFALATGMRRGEVLSLNWPDVDLARRIALLRQTKNGEPRRVPLSEGAMGVLHEIAPGGLGPVKAKVDIPCQAIFPISANAVRLAWERAKKRSGIEDLRFHDLRHEAITRYFEFGLSVPEVALISGHKDARVLLAYANPRAEDLVLKINGGQRI
jgi:integrase